MANAFRWNLAMLFYLVIETEIEHFIIYTIVVFKETGKKDGIYYAFHFHL